MSTNFCFVLAIPFILIPGFYTEPVAAGFGDSKISTGHVGSIQIAGCDDDNKSSNKSSFSNDGRKVRVGSLAPNMNFKDVHIGTKRKTFDLKSLRGKVVILEYWGPFCGPCIKAFPHINKLTDEFKGKPVRFISIADQGFSGCKKVLNDHPLSTWKVFDISLFEPFAIEAMPTTIIIDKTGKVVLYTKPTRLNSKLIKKVLAGESLDSN